jgi:hypothetical protein
VKKCRYYQFKELIPDARFQIPDSRFQNFKEQMRDARCQMPDPKAP